MDEISQQSRFWIGVVSASHVKCGELEGFSQLCHGKSVPLRKMRGNVYELRRGGSGMSPDDYKTFKGTSTFDSIEEGASQLIIQPIEIAGPPLGEVKTEIKLEPIVIDLKKE